MLIVYAVIAQLSPLRLFAAAIFPGLMLAGLYILYVIIRAYFKKVEDKIFVNLKRLFYLVILQVTVGIFVVISKLAFSMTAVHLLIALIIVGVILNLLFAKKEVNS